jgi:hypothetical protein
LTDNARILLQHNEFKNNLMHHRALIYTDHFSRFQLDFSNFTDNRAVFDSALIYMDGPPYWESWTHSREDTDSPYTNYFEVFPFWHMWDMRSYIYEVRITGTTMENGGSIISVVNANLDIIRLYMLQNEMFSKHGGITMFGAVVEISNS